MAFLEHFRLRFGSVPREDTNHDTRTQLSPSGVILQTRANYDFILQLLLSVCKQPRQLRPTNTGLAQARSLFFEFLLGLLELHSSSRGHLPFFLLFFLLPFPKKSPHANKDFIVGQSLELPGNSKQDVQESTETCVKSGLTFVGIFVSVKNKWNLNSDPH